MPKTLVAIDLGNYTIKAVQAKTGKVAQVLKTAQVFNTLNTNLAGDEPSTEKLAQFLDNFFNDYALSRNEVLLALPEHLVSTKIISIPSLTDAELASAISWQAEQHIPIPLDELSLEYQVLYRPGKNEHGGEMRVLMIGARKSVIEKYLEVFLRAGIEPTLLETTTLSILRGLEFTTEDATSLVVHMGAFHTDMFVVSKGELRFVYTTPSGGQVLTRTIEQATQLDQKQAEEYKRAYGLDPNQLKGQMREVLLTGVRGQILEMQKTMQFFSSQANAEPVKRILLSGGAAQLPGLVEYITEQLGVEVLMASPFATATGALPQADHPAFAVCTGLLMKEE